MQPASFDLDRQGQWSRWVILHGLPKLPGTELDLDQAMPVAYWIGPTTAAVLHIRRYVDESELVTQTDVDLFHLDDSGWQGSGSGGGGWVDDSPLARIDVPPTYVNLHGMSSGSTGDRGAKALWGEVGTEATWAEVIQDGQTTRRPVEARTGLLVVCAELAQPFTVRVLNAHGDVLAEVEERAEPYGR